MGCKDNVLKILSLIIINLNKLQAKLEEKYGKIKIDIQTGNYEPIEEEEDGEQVVGPEVLKKA